MKHQRSNAMRDDNGQWQQEQEAAEYHEKETEHGK